MFWKVAAVLIIVLLGLNLFKENKTVPKTIQQTLSVSISPSLSPSISDTQTETYIVSKVIDGDTIDVTKDGKKQTLRLIGIDTPETVNPRKPVQCFGTEASNKAKELLSGKTVTLEKDPTQGEKDKYGRTLAYIFLEDKTNFNKLMISEGFAYEYTYNLPYKYQTGFKQAEIDAKNNKRGLWADGACDNQARTVTPTASVQTSNQTVQVQTKIIPNGSYTCDCSKLCGQMTTCDEANYQLQNCGCTARDSDGDGIPCESLCK